MRAEILGRRGEQWVVRGERMDWIDLGRPGEHGSCVVRLGDGRTAVAVGARENELRGNVDIVLIVEGEPAGRHVHITGRAPTMRAEVIGKIGRGGELWVARGEHKEWIAIGRPGEGDEPSTVRLADGRAAVVVTARANEARGTVDLGMTLDGVLAERYVLVEQVHPPTRVRNDAILTAGGGPVEPT